MNAQDSGIRGPASGTAGAAAPVRWAKLVDHARCIGCHACSTACKSENQVPLSVNRTYVKYVDVGVFPQARRAFQVTRCNQCARPPCVFACPTAAMYQRPDGIVDFDKSVCIGCKACIAACPYDAIFINPVDHSAEKCNFCAHRIEIGLEPACVVVCPTEAIAVGNLADTESRVARVVGREPVTVRRPEKDTQPKLFYRGAHHATLDPLAARRPEGGLFLWSEQGDLPHQVRSGHPGPANGAEDAVLAYDVPHRAPWDWRVSLYTWTKSIASGAYLAALLLVLLGALPAEGALWQWAAPVVAEAFLGATGLILIADLEHRARFPLIFTRPQWRSWLVRGGVAITAYGLVLAAHLVGSLTRDYALQRAMMWPGGPLAVLSAIYTAYLFAQSKGRDLWQNPLLPVQLLVQAVLAGAAVLLVVAPWLEADALPALVRLTTGALVVQLVLVAAEMTLAHPTAHARLAAREMVAGRYAAFFWGGLALMAGALVAAWISAAAVLALAGLLAYEHAYVQAGQSVPLA
jgi:Fe-S-cluster-containing dehydrogenase component/formate-dependent nitrite reductase membrane component NrfD